MNYIGDKYGRLTVISTFKVRKYLKTTGKGYNVLYGVCKCDCGKECNVVINKMRTGNTKSCGCYVSDLLVKRNYSHGVGLHPAAPTYYAMLKRCTDSNHRAYKHYGGRGIKVCDEWLNDITSFIKWSDNNGYEKGLQLDRIDVNGNYEPNNCRYITAKENHRNRRNNVWIGDELLDDMILRLSKVSGIKVNTLRSRYYKLKRHDIEITDDNLINCKPIRKTL